MNGVQTCALPIFLVIGMIVIAANAGGAWSPIGDVTTTMLWIGGQITAANIMIKLILPSLVCLIVPLLFTSRKLSVTAIIHHQQTHSKSSKADAEQKIVFFLGISTLIFVPVFKSITHLPPFMGMLGGLAVMWIVTEFLHKNKSQESKSGLTVQHALDRKSTRLNSSHIPLSRMPSSA